MSEQAAEGVLIDPSQGDTAFATLMGALVAAEPGAEAPAADAAAGAGAGAGGDAAPAAGATGAGADTPVAGGAGDTTAPGGAVVPGAGSDSAVPDGGAAGAGADAAGGSGDPAPPPGTVAVADLAPEWGKLSTGLEAKLAEAYQAEALEETKQEYSKYFEILEKHPRLIVGQKVPDLAPGSDADVTLRDEADARSWQEALKSVLVDEVRGRATKLADDNAAFLTTIHSSIELFQNNSDLVPGTKEFDLDLATRFTQMAEPYELRVDGKLQGYNINVQPLIGSLRDTLAKEREAAKGAAPAAPAAGAPATTPGAPAAPAAPKAEDLPQAGIQSKAGNGDNPEDFSALFGTLGLPNLRF